MRYCLPLFMFLSFSLRAQTFQWADTIEFTKAKLVTAIVIDDDRNVYVASSDHVDEIASFSIAGNIHLRKYDVNGAFLWEKIFTGKGHIFDMKVDHDNNLIAGGGFIDELNIGDGLTATGGPFVSARFLSKIDPDGNVLWAVYADGMMNTYIHSVTIGDDNSIYVTGLSDDISALLQKYDTDGNLKKNRPLPHVRTSADAELDGNGNIYVAGTADGYESLDGLPFSTGPEIDPYVNYLARFDSDFTADQLMVFPYITFDMQTQVEKIGNRIYWRTYNYDGLGLSYSVNVSWFDMPSVDLHTHTMYYDYDLFSYDGFVTDHDSRIYMQTRTLNGTGIWVLDDYGSLIDSFFIAPAMTASEQALVADSTGLWMGGTFYMDSLPLDTILLENDSLYKDQCYIAKYGFAIPVDTGGTDSTLQVHDFSNNDFTVFPALVPAGNAIHIYSSQRITEIQCFDLHGKLILSDGEKIDNYYAVKIPETVVPGMYFIRMTDADGKSGTAKIIVQ